LPESCWEALLSAVVSCKKCILASCGVLEEESPPGLSDFGYQGGKGRSMGDRPHLGVGNAYFLMRCLFAAFRLLLLLLKIPAATRLSSTLGSDRRELVEVKLRGMRSLSRFNATNLGCVIVLKAESVRGEERMRPHSLWA
jgi:hypothetical protein